MAFARAKKGTLRVVSEGKEYLLGGEFQEIPDALGAEIAPHVNVEVSAGPPREEPKPQVEERGASGKKAAK